MLSSSFATTIPSPKGLVDSGVRILSGLSGSQLRLHSTHSGTERLASSGSLLRFRCLSLLDGCLEVHPLRFSRGTTFGVETTLGVLACFALPRRGLCHYFFFFAIFLAIPASLIAIATACFLDLTTGPFLPECRVPRLYSPITLATFLTAAFFFIVTYFFLLVFLRWASICFIKPLGYL